MKPVTLAARERKAARKKQAALEKETNMDSQMVEELTRRLPTADLVKIIKGALDCGRRNVPFTESDLLRAMTFGTSAGYVRPSKGRDAEAAR
jgi:hypothetical protein